MSLRPGGWLYDLGLRLPDLIAGFAGGVVNALVFHRAEPLSIVTSTVVGALTANYLGEPSSHVTGLSEGASSFVVGLAAMAITQGIMTAVQQWRPSPPSNPQ
jgi:hypothetical protein